MALLLVNDFSGNGEKRLVNIVQLVVNTPIFYGRGNKTPINMGGIFKDSALPLSMLRFLFSPSYLYFALTQFE